MVGIRDIVNRNPKTIVVVSVVFMAIALAGVLWSFREPTISLPTTTYFSIDDGQSFFPDDATKIPPFMQGGKQVVGAKVFVGSDGRKFVGYLERAIDEQARVKLKKLWQDVREAWRVQPSAGPDAELMNEITACLEVKRPGEEQWVKAASTEGRRVLIVKSPDGSAPELVVP